MEEFVQAQPSGGQRPQSWLLAAALVAQLLTHHEARSDEVTLTVQSGDATLAGTLILPSTPAPHPAVVVLHGSGQVTRRAGGRWAPSLAERGIAVLRYDKRGVGESTGTYTSPDLGVATRLFTELARDALAWVDLLRARPDIRSEQIGLIGGSQAGWIMPLAADMDPAIAFIVNVSGPVVTGGQEIYYSWLTQEQHFDETHRVNGFTMEELMELTRDYDGPHDFDPMPFIRKLDIPALWVYGERDESQPTQLCVQMLRELDKPNLEVMVVPRANHNFIDVATGESIAYFDAPRGARDWIVDAIRRSDAPND